MKALTTAPSTTITWAALVGLGTTFIWGMIETFTAIEPSAMVVSGSTAFFSALAGKLVPEKRYKMTVRD